MRGCLFSCTYTGQSFSQHLVYFSVLTLTQFSSLSTFLPYNEDLLQSVCSFRKLENQVESTFSQFARYGLNIVGIQLKSRIRQTSDATPRQKFTFPPIKPCESDGFCSHLGTSVFASEPVQLARFRKYVVNGPAAHRTDCSMSIRVWFRCNYGTT